MYLKNICLCTFIVAVFKVAMVLCKNYVFQNYFQALPENIEKKRKYGIFTDREGIIYDLALGNHKTI